VYMEGLPSFCQEDQAASRICGEYYQEVDEYEEMEPYSFPTKLQGQLTLKELSYKNALIN